MHPADIRLAGSRERRALNDHPILYFIDPVGTYCFLQLKQLKNHLDFEAMSLIICLCATESVGAPCHILGEFESATLMALEAGMSSLREAPARKSANTPKVPKAINAR